MSLTNNMRIILVLLASCSLVVCLNDEYMKKISKIIEECQQDPATQASEKWLKAENGVSNLEGEGAHIFCRLKKVGCLKENGDIDKEAMSRDLSSAMDANGVKKIVEKCGTRSPGTSPEKSAIDNYRCVYLAYQELS